MPRVNQEMLAYIRCYESMLCYEQLESGDSGHLPQKNFGEDFGEDIGEDKNGEENMVKGPMLLPSAHPSLNPMQYGVA